MCDIEDATCYVENAMCDVKDVMYNDDIATLFDIKVKTMHITCS